MIPNLKRESDITTAKDLLKVAEDIAGTLYDIHLTGAREDAFRNPMQLYGRLSALASDLNGSGIDFPPTNQQGEVKEILSNKLDTTAQRLEDLISEDIKEFNQKLNRKDRIINIEEKADSN